jgi:HAE1 family hydrophobic/amphiphilic exporter-1
MIISSFKKGYQNPVFINLIMLIVIALGFISAFQLKKELFPPFDTETIQVTIVMEEGSTVEAVDKNIIELVYPSLQSIDGVKEVRSTASKYAGTFMVDIHNYADVNIVKQEIKDALDQITDLPKESEPPIVKAIKRHENVLKIAVYGENSTALELQNLLKDIKSSLIADGIVSLAKFSTERQSEIRITIPLEELRAKGLTLEELAQQIESYTLDRTAGKVRGHHTHTFVEVSTRKYTPEEFGEIPIRFSNGEFILLKDLVTEEGLYQGFEEDNVFIEFMGLPASVLTIDKAEHEDIIELSESIKNYLTTLTLPEGVEIVTFDDSSKFVSGRLSLITKNAISGLILVILILSFLLDWRVAFWAACGIAFSLLGAFAVLYFLGDSINVLSLFGFLMASGIVVDDAIIIGEEFFSFFKKNKNGEEAARLALKQVAKPVFGMLLTTVLAFIPLLFVQGIMGKFISVIPTVVIATLILSLLESLFILPVHLAHHMKAGARSVYSLLEKLLKPYIWLCKKGHPPIEKLLNRFIEKVVRPSLKWTIQHRYAVVIFYLALTLLIVGSIPAGWIKLSLFPNLDSEFYQAKIFYAEGTPSEKTKQGTDEIIKALEKANKEIEARDGIPPVMHHHTLAEGNQGKVSIQLISADAGRKISGQNFVEIWRSKLPEFPEALSVEFGSYKGAMKQYPILIEFNSSSSQDLSLVKEKTKEYLSQFKGVVDIGSNEELGAEIVKIKLKEDIGNLPLSEAVLSKKLIHILNGIKVDTFVEGDTETDIYVRASLDDREDIHQLENYYLPSGLQLGQVTDISFVREPVSIERQDGQRLLKVYANIEASSLPLANEIRGKIRKEWFPQIQADYPFMKVSLGGEAREGNEAFMSLFKAYIPAICAIYLILATLFRSYLQPFIIMLAIPFCFIGALIGHFIMGFSFNLMSTFGVIALGGIAVNDSLVLIDYINYLIREGKTLKEALLAGGIRRFRPIFLTSVSTISCLSPVLLETSFQAQFLLPMVTSLVFGLAFATFFIVLLVPIGFHILLDVMQIFHRMFYKEFVPYESLIKK